MLARVNSARVGTHAVLFRRRGFDLIHRLSAGLGCATAGKLTLNARGSLLGLRKRRTSVTSCVNGPGDNRQ